MIYGGAIFNGLQQGDILGYSVSAVGDLNNDGIGDVLLGAQYADRNAETAPGEAYVLFGRSDAFVPFFDLSTLDGTNGFILRGTYYYEKIGEGFGTGGDLTGDGIDDLMLNFRGYDPDDPIATGRVIILPGSESGFDSLIHPSQLPTADGLSFIISGDNGYLADPAAIGGDINGDGFQDLLTVLWKRDTETATSTSEAHVFLGSQQGLPTDEDQDLFLKITNETSYAHIDFVNAIGDVNADGRDDFIVGASYGAYESPGDSPQISRLAVVFGSDFDPTDPVPVLDFSDFDGTNGFVFEEPAHETPYPVKRLNNAVPLGDVNGDGIDDFSVAGGDHEAYVVFGTSAGFAPKLLTSDLNGQNGFILSGPPESYAGHTIGGAGDVNGDGLNDILIGGAQAESYDSRHESYRAGVAYLVFGQENGFSATLDLQTLDGSSGYRLIGEDKYDRAGQSVAIAGDVNNDGFDDLLIGASGTDANDLSQSGSAYLVYGGSALTQLDVLDETQDGTIYLANTPAILGAGFGDDTIMGTPLSDLLLGSSGNDTLRGGQGEDTLNGGSGTDWLIGQDGGDLFIVDHLADRIGESRNWHGVDTVESSVDFALGRQHIENLTLTGEARVGTGNGLANIIIGNDADNILDGGKNNDTLIGGLGNDVYLIRAPGDTAVEQAGEGNDAVKAYRSYALEAHVEKLYMQNVFTKDGNPANLNGIGNGLDNTIIGTPYANTIVGREGNDTLKGQGGADTFVFDRALDEATNVDRIIDFGDGDDVFKLKASVFSGLSAGALAADAFVLGTAAADANDRIIYDQTTGQLWHDGDGVGGADATLFATLANKATLEADDFSIF